MAELAEAGLVLNADKRCFLIGPSNGSKSCMLRMNEQRISLVSQDSNMVLDLFWFVMELSTQIAKLPGHRWTQRILHWQPVGVEEHK